MSVYERLFPRFRPGRALQPRGNGDGAAVRITWLGTAGFIVETATTTLLLDPFLTRPGLLSAGRRIVPDEEAITKHTPRRVDAVLCGHSHYDHAADAPRIARLTGATLVGSASTCAWGRAEGLPEDRLAVVPAEGARFRFGDVAVRFVSSRHGRIFFGRVPLPGEIQKTPTKPGRFWDYKMGGAYGILVETEGVSIYHNGSADLVDAELRGERADVLLACLAGRRGTANYVGRLISALDPTLVVPNHHDAFFAPLERGVHLLPGIDVDGFVSEVTIRAPKATLIAPEYEQPICIPAGDSRGAVIAS